MSKTYDPNQQNQRVLGVLGGNHTPLNLLETWGNHADVIYGADSGADTALAANLTPIAIGDLDSIQADLTTLKSIKIDNQNFSDCDKLINHILQNHSQPKIVIAGIEGDRLDHVLASLASLTKPQIYIQLLLQRGTGHILPPNFNDTLPTTNQTLISLLPLTPCNISLDNVQWPLTNQDFIPNQTNSLSNRALGPINVQIHQGSALLVVEEHPNPW